MIFFGTAKSQISNRLALDSMIIGHFHKDTISIGKMTGFLEEDYRAYKSIQTGDSTRLTIEEPSITYTKLEDSRFERRIAIDLVYEDSAEIRVPLLMTDTLRRQDISASRKVEPRSLRGQDPRFSRKFLYPAIGIGGGIAGIISLFYIRSSSR